MSFSRVRHIQVQFTRGSRVLGEDRSFISRFDYALIALTTLYGLAVESRAPVPVPPVIHYTQSELTAMPAA